MFKLIPWTPELDLSEFYSIADSKGFTNNSSKSMLIDSIAKENVWCVWILYYNNVAVGSMGAHSFPEMGPAAFRIVTRSCVFTDMLSSTYRGNTLRTVSDIKKHQHVIAQFYIPKCIEWVPADCKLYITSNDSSVGTQRLIHKICMPTLADIDVVKPVREFMYRNTLQTVWEVYADKFLTDLNRYPRWVLE